MLTVETPYPGTRDVHIWSSATDTCVMCGVTRVELANKLGVDAAVLECPGRPNADAHGHLDPGQSLCAFPVLPQRHQQIQGEIRDERKRVGGISRLRRRERVDVLEVVLTQVCPIPLWQIGKSRQEDFIFPSASRATPSSRLVT